MLPDRELHSTGTSTSTTGPVLIAGDLRQRSVTDPLYRDKVQVFDFDQFSLIHDQQRIIPLQILGAPAIVSEGPFIMAYLLDVPIYVIHCFRVGKKFRIQLKAISVPLEKSKANRSEYIRQIANQYGLELQSLIQKDPLQWFNFFDFWRMKA